MQSTTLQSLQQHFSDCLFDNSKNVKALGLKKQKNDDNDERLNIYRNNVFYSLCNALADLYPVIKKLTGSDFFNGTARSYLNNHPPKQAAMVYFAEDFPDFLLNFEHTKKHTWLADVARLELAWHQSYHAKDAAPLSLEEFSRFPVEHLAQVKLKLHSSLRLIQSTFPVLKIWESNCSENDTNDKIDLDSGGDNLYIIRPKYDVIVGQLDNRSFAFLQQLHNGITLENAMLFAMEIQSGFTMDQCLAKCLTSSMFEKINEDIA